MERTGVGAEKKRLQINSAAVSDQCTVPIILHIVDKLTAVVVRFKKMVYLKMFCAACGFEGRSLSEAARV